MTCLNLFFHAGSGSIGAGIKIKNIHDLKQKINKVYNLYPIIKGFLLSELRTMYGLGLTVLQLWATIKKGPCLFKS